jgi:hypothetical protein
MKEEAIARFGPQHHVKKKSEEAVGVYFLRVGKLTFHTVSTLISCFERLI